VDYAEAVTEGVKGRVDVLAAVVSPEHCDLIVGLLLETSQTRSEPVHKVGLGSQGGEKVIVVQMTDEHTTIAGTTN